MAHFASPVKHFSPKPCKGCGVVFTPRSATYTLGPAGVPRGPQARGGALLDGDATKPIASLSVDPVSRDPFWWWVLAAAAIFMILIGVAFYVVPVVTLPDEDLMPPGDFQQARGVIRGSAIQAVGAIAIGVGLTLTARSVTLATRSLAVNREAQLGERVGRAIDHLASDKVEVRVGGVYSLERIAENAPWERRIIFEVLTSLVGERTDPESQTNLHTQSGIPRGRDAEAALAVLDRWPWPLDRPYETSNRDDTASKDCS